MINSITLLEKFDSNEIKKIKKAIFEEKKDLRVQANSEGLNNDENKRKRINESLLKLVKENSIFKNSYEKKKVSSMQKILLIKKTDRFSYLD